MDKNPFVFGRPVENDGFYDRKEETETAIGFIKSRQNLSVIGQRRIGKTSFLIHLLSRETLVKHGIDPEQYIAVHFGIDSLYEITKDLFTKTLVKRIGEQVHVRKESLNAFEKLTTLIEKLDSSNKNLIIALDEFDATRPLLDDLSHWLRYIFQSPNVVAITASRIKLGKLSPETTESPLFNIFGNLTLGLFSQKEAENMIKDMFRKGGKVLRKDEVSFLADLSGGNPYLIQLLGFHYYSRKMKKDEFEKNMLYQARDVFEGYWKYLPREEREFLLNVETLDNDRVGHSLEMKGFLVREGRKWRIFSRLFEDFLSSGIMEEKRK